MTDKKTEYFYNETISKLDKYVSNYDTVVHHDYAIPCKIITVHDSAIVKR